MVRTAAASMAKVTHRNQEVQWRTWCSSRPVRPLLAWKFSSMVHRSPATATRASSVTSRRTIAAVEGQFASAPVPADQQVPVSWAGIADGDPGPVVPAQSFSAPACGEPLPGAPGQAGSQLDRARTVPGPGRDPAVARDRQDAGDVLVFQPGAQRSVVSVHFIVGTLRSAGCWTRPKHQRDRR